MDIKKLKNNVFEVESSKKGKFWKVDLDKDSCNCPAFLYRGGFQGNLCKHVKEVNEKFGTIKKEFSGKEKIVKFLKENGETDSIELIEKFGEELIDKLLDDFEIVEKRGKISLLE